MVLVQVSGDMSALQLRTLGRTGTPLFGSLRSGAGESWLFWLAADSCAHVTGNLNAWLTYCHKINPLRSRDAGRNRTFLRMRVLASRAGGDGPAVAGRIFGASIQNPQFAIRFPDTGAERVEATTWCARKTVCS
jgi:hypothetical protein